MHTILLQLSGPMQSWGSDSQFILRTTHRDPTKSGVIGLCSAALGWPRTDDISPLLQLQMGVRIINPGVMMKDYHTIENVILAKGSGKKTVVSTRYYLSDANFLVGLEGSDLKFLEQLHNALHHPKFCISLGRKSYVPSKPVFILNGLREDEELESALINFPINGSTELDTINLIIEVPINEADEIRLDQPLQNSFETRKFNKRGIIRKTIQVNKVDE